VVAKEHSRADTRTRLLATALELFGEYGVEGTSLQMIANALGVTKAAVYYHFRTKSEITEAVAAPALAELDTILDEAVRLDSREACVDHILEGFVELVVRHRGLVALFSSDPGIARAVEKSMHSAAGFHVRMPELLAGPDAATGRHVAVHVALAGIALAGGSFALADLDDETLREHLRNTGRKLLDRPVGGADPRV